MKDDESALARWSRRKHEAEKDKRSVSQAQHVEGAIASDAEIASSAEPVDAERPPFDPATLPPIDSIVAGSDIRAFLQSGVPMELTKAALRRAWTTDPAIREFIEIAENQWDFTNPATIPGFGPLQAGDDIGQLVTRAMGKWPEAPSLTTAAAEPPAAAAASPPQHSQLSGIPEQSGTATPVPVQVDLLDENAIAATQHVESQSTTADIPYRRGHGGALPK